MAKQCVFYWGNVPAEGGGSFTLQAGIAPSTGVLRFTLGQRYAIRQIADLTLTDNAGTTRVFRNCRLTRSTINQSGGGGRWFEIQFQDRRWAWGEQYFAIYGQYNRYAAIYSKNFIKTSQELASLCCEAMNEPRWDVSQLNSQYGPQVDWDAENPAVQLQALAEAEGCIVTLSNTDVVVIHRDGYGRTPTPDDRQMDFTAASELPIIPAAIVFEGGRTHIQHDLTLKPVGKEISTAAAYKANYGKYVPIDSLSYKPATGGWEKATYLANPPFANHWNDPAYRKQAEADIWKAYQIAGPINLPQPPERIANRTDGKKLTATQQMKARDFFQIKLGEQWRVCPFNLKQNLATVGALSVANNQDDAQVIGFRWTGGNPGINTLGTRDYSEVLATAPGANAQSPDKRLTAIPLASTSPLLVPSSEYDLEPDMGIVRFKKPTPFHDLNANDIKPALLRLRTSFPLRDRDNAATMCQQWWQAPGSPLAANVAKIIKRSDVWLEYDIDKQSNEDAFVGQALAYIAQELNTYQIGAGYSAPYKGFVVDINIDGIVRAVSWDVSDSGAGTTHVDYNMERPEAYYTLAEARSRRLATYQLWVAWEKDRKQKRGVP